MVRQDADGVRFERQARLDCAINLPQTLARVRKIALDAVPRYRACRAILHTLRAHQGDAVAAIRRDAAQRFENWNDRRALALPYFLRSTTRESRVRKPPCLSTPRNSGS